MMEPTSSPREVQVAVHNVMLELQRDLIRAAGTKDKDGQPLITPAEQQAYGTMARNAMWRTAIGGVSSAALTNFLVARATGPAGDVLRRKLIRFPAVLGSLMVGATVASNFGVRDQMVAAMSLPDEDSPVGARARTRLIRQAPNSETLRLIRERMSRDGIALTEPANDANTNASMSGGQQASGINVHGTGSVDQGAAWGAHTGTGMNTGIVLRGDHDSGAQLGRSDAGSARSSGSVGSSSGNKWGSSAAAKGSGEMSLGQDDGAHRYGTIAGRDDFDQQSSVNVDAFDSGGFGNGTVQPPTWTADTWDAPQGAEAGDGSVAEGQSGQSHNQNEGTPGAVTWDELRRRAAQRRGQ